MIEWGQEGMSYAEDERINGDIRDRINEQVESEVKRRYDDIILERAKKSGHTVDRNVGGWDNAYITQEEKYDLLNQLRKAVRNEVLEEYEFGHKIKETRHLDQIQKEQNGLDAMYARDIEASENNDTWNQNAINSQQGDIIHDDIGGISVNRIVDKYANIAELFNISDTKAMENLISNSNNGLVDGNTFRQLIEDSNGRRAIELIMKDNNGNVDLNQLGQMIDSVATTRLKTASEYMDVAKKDIEARTFGVDQKSDALYHVIEKIVDGNKKFLESANNRYTSATTIMNDREKQILKRITSSEIEEATSDIRTSEINSMLQMIRNELSKQHEKSDKDISYAEEERT